MRPAPHSPSSRIISLIIVVFLEIRYIIVELIGEAGEQAFHGAKKC